MSFPPFWDIGPYSISVSRSDACALSLPVHNGEALIVATSLPENSPEDTVQSSALFRVPGIPKAYSGVLMSTPSAACSSLRRE